MDYAKLIDPDESGPIYQQITRNLALWIQDGLLSPGDRLPTERELADILGVSRGTVSRAYEHLGRMEIIESSPGRGTVISASQDILPLSRKDRAVKVLEDAFREISGMQFTEREILTMAQLVFMEMESTRGTVHAAAVDCNPESLRLLEEDLRYLHRLRIYPFNLYSVLDEPETRKQLQEYDLIITTTSHGYELENALPDLRERIVKVPMNPSRQTIIDMTQIGPEASIGVFCESDRFFEIISEQLASFDLQQPVRLRAETSPDELNELDIVILPPSKPGGTGTGIAPDLARFKQRGGRCFVFSFQIDRDTMTYIEERVKGLLEAGV